MFSKRIFLSFYLERRSNIVINLVAQNSCSMRLGVNSDRLAEFGFARISDRETKNDQVSLAMPARSLFYMLLDWPADLVVGL